MTDIAIETGNAYLNDPAALTCFCNNSTMEDGFMSVDTFGTPLLVWQESDQEEGGWRHFPEDKSEVCSACYICGRVYKNDTIEHGNPDAIPVFFTLTKSELAEVTKIYNRINELAA